MTFYRGLIPFAYGTDRTTDNSMYQQLLELKRKYEPYQFQPYTTEMPSSINNVLDIISSVRRQAIDAGLDIADMKIVSENPDDPYDLKVNLTFRPMDFPTILRGEDDGRE